MKRWLSLALPIGLGVVVGAAALVPLAPFVPTRPHAHGLRVGGREVPRSPLDPWLAARDRELRARPVALLGGGKRLETTLGELGAALDVDKTREAALAIGHVGSLPRRMREARRARTGQLDVPLVLALDEAAAARVLERFAQVVDTAPTDAVLDLARHARVADVSGISLEVPASVALLRVMLDVVARGPSAAHDGADAGVPRLDVELATSVLRAKVTLHDLEDIEVDKILSTFETKYQPFKVGRSANVELAAQKLDGTVLRSGQVVSFNERIGPRTRAAGFHEAPEIQGDELTVGIGGGTCQVSSTLFGAAVYGGLAVIERKSHTRPSDYTLLGLDATVSYGAVDLKLANPHPFTIVVHAFTPAKGTLKIELLGGERVKSVKYGFGISNIEPFLRRIVEKPFLTAGRSFRKQKGTRGMDVHSTVLVNYADGHSDTRQFYSGYRATPEIFWIAPGSDRAELPPLPEHSRGVEGELSAGEPSGEPG